MIRYLTPRPDTTGDAKVEVAWSPDSQHVVVVENGERGISAIIGSLERRGWHKTIELDRRRSMIQAQQARFHGRLVSEHRKLAGWITPSEVAVQGDMTSQAADKYHYGYTLAFRPGPGRLDRGGYEEGELVGKDYHTL